MNAELTLYTISILGNISNAIAVIGVLSLLLLIFSLIMRCNEDFDDINIKKYLKLSLILLAISVFVGILIPDQKTMYMMASTHYLKKSDIPSKVLEILNHKLDEIIKENKKG